MLGVSHLERGEQEFDTANKCEGTRLVIAQVPKRIGDVSERGIPQHPACEICQPTAKP